jgi:ribosomal protein L11 methyltransferase
VTQQATTGIPETVGISQSVGDSSAVVASSPIDPSGREWTCVAVSCGGDHTDDLAALVAERFQVGVEITEDGIRFYLAGEAAATGTWITELQQALDDFRGISGQALPLRFTSHLVADEGWGDRWKEHFKPLRAGRFIISPTWEEPRAASGDLVIRIDPGQAFGTGHHETTRLCLEWLGGYDELLSRQDRAAAPSPHRPSFLDVGTGTAILAMGAALLGWSEVVAIDIDPEAVQVAAENVSINGLDARIRVQVGGVDQAEGRFDVVMANIQALPLIDLAGALAARLVPGGRLVLSGILREQRDEVIAAYAARGLRLHSESAAGEWCLLELADASV